MNSTERNQPSFSDRLRWATLIGITIAHEYDDQKLLDLNLVLEYDNMDLPEIYFGDEKDQIQVRNSGGDVNVEEYGARER
jgi:hypothetical protein